MSEKNNLAFSNDFEDKEDDTKEDTAHTATTVVLDDDKTNLLSNSGSTQDNTTENKSDGLTEEQVEQRKAWADELDKVEDEMKTLRDVLNAKQKRASELKKLLGFNIVTDVKEKVKTIQESDVVLRTNLAFKTAGERTSAAFSNIGKKFGDVRLRLGESIGTSFSNVKKSKSLFMLPSEARVNGSRFDLANRMKTNRSSSATSTVSSPLEEDISLYDDLDENHYDY